MTQKSITPEDLYLHYRQTRPRTLPEMASYAAAGNGGQRSAADAELSPLPEQVYLEYQRRRQENREESIDAILSLIRREQTTSVAELQTDSDSDSDSDSASENARQPLSAAQSGKPASGGLLTSLLDLVKQRLELRSPAVLLPVVAAGLLALIVFPQVFNSTDTRSGIPESLVSQAPSAVEYIDNDGAGIMAFSSSVAPGKSAFNRGVLATSYLVAVQAQDEQVVSDTLRYISSSAEAEGQADLVTLAADILESNNNRLMDNVETTADSIVAMLKIVAESSGHELWFEHGQALQAVTLSAQLQQSASDSQPLRDSLAVYNVLATPLQVLPASKLVQELKSIDSQSVLDSASSRKIVRLTRDIKILMR